MWAGLDPSLDLSEKDRCMLRLGKLGEKKLAGTVPSALKFVADSVLEIQSIVSLLSGFLLDFVCAVLLDFTTTGACS